MRSLEGRLTLWVTGTILAIFAAITLFIYLVTGTGIYIEADGRYQGVIDNNNARIDATLNAVEVAVANNVPFVEAEIGNPDKMYDAVRRILTQNPNIVGSAVAFEPNFYPQKGVQFAPYAFRNDSTMQTKQLGTDDYTYHSMGWYLKPKQLGKPCWSEPYYDTGVGEMTMATYSYPLFDKEGKFYAVLTADIALEWLSHIVQRTDSINNSKSLNGDASIYSFIVGREGTYIIHPDKKRILNETIFSYFAETADTLDDHIAYDMIAGKQGKDIIQAKDETYIYYAPIQRTGWSMAIVVPQKEILEVVQVIGTIIVALMVIGLLIVSFVCHKVIRRITRPLTRFADTADEIAKGNFETPLPEIHSRDEMRQLHDSFLTMQRSLNQQIEETKEVNEQKGRIESELHIARKIQEAMLPKTFPPFPDRTDIDIYGMLAPAKEVGGDLYDFFIRDEQLFFCIGDVSGKGVPASIVMAVTRAQFRTTAAHESEPAAIVSTLNDTMAEGNDYNMFVTLFVGVFNLATGCLRYCNAGHDAPILVNTESNLYGHLPVEANLPVGIMQGTKFVAQETLIDPGTTLFLYTDGLTEAEDANHQLFGEQRLIDNLMPPPGNDEAKPQTSTVRNLITRMADAVHLFVGEAEQSDDLTMLAIQYSRQQSHMRMQRSITLPNDVAEVPQLATFVDEVCETLGFDMSVAMQINLAIEEAVVNVMNYAYPEGTRGNINVIAQANDERLKFVISDSGTPFDPTVREQVDITLAVEERPIGGLGIHLVRQIMDSINYQRDGDKNVLTLRKIIYPPKSQQKP